MRLSDALIASERYRGEPTTDEEGRTQWPLCVLWDDELQGFGVRIFPPVRGRPSRKDFIVTFKVGLKSRTMSIGTHGVDCSLRQARRTAREALDLARRGQDPIEARQRALGIGTAEDLASRFLFEHTAAKKKPAAPPTTPDAAAEVVAGRAPEGEAPAAAEAPAAEAPAAEAPTVAGDPAVAEASAVAEAPAQAEDSVEAPAEGIAAVPASPTPAAPSVAPAPEAVASSPAPSPIATESSEAGAMPDAEITPPAEPEPDPDTRAGLAPKIDDPPRRTMPAPPAPPAAKRGPTKVRLLPVPDSLYRTIEHGARESGMTVAVYLGALIEIARAAVGEDAGEHQTTDASGTTSAENGPSIKELFARVQEAQAVEVGQSSAADGDSELGEPSD